MDASREATRRQNVLFLGVGAGDLKQNTNEHASGCQILAYHVPHIPLFPKHPRPLDKTFFITWMHSPGAKNKMGTMAGTRVLCA